MKVKEAEFADPQSLHCDSTPQIAACSAALEELCNDKCRLRKLKSYARFLVFGVTGVRQYADADDLLNEAIVRTFDGRRKWKPEKVDLDAHLKGCMQSIANQHGKEAARYSRETTLIQEPSQENRMTMLMFDKMRSRLEGDKTASDVLGLLLEWNSPSEIRDILGIKRGVYRAARARVSRCLRRIFGVLPKPSDRTTK